MSSTEDQDAASTSENVSFDNGMYSLYTFIPVHSGLCTRRLFLVMSRYMESAKKQRRALSLKTRKRKGERAGCSPGKKKKVDESPELPSTIFCMLFCI